MDALNQNMTRQIDHLLEQKHEVLSSRDELGAEVERLRSEARESRGVIERQAAQIREVKEADTGVWLVLVLGFEG